MNPKVAKVENAALKVTVAPLSTVTLSPKVMAAALEQEQVVPVRYMAFVITPLAGQGGMRKH